MASIRQTVPAFVAGMSEQPDHLKFPGQVTEALNAIPDVTQGLYKRPGTERVKTDKSPLTNVQSGGSWFHYYRDDQEGAYIGQTAANGQVRLWKCSDGSEMDVLYGAAAWDTNKDYFINDRVQNSGKIYDATIDINNTVAAPTHSSGTTNGWLFVENASAAQTRVTNYLTTNTPEDLQFLTINDTTFVCNRDTGNANTKVGNTGTTPEPPEPHYAMVELLRTENGRQYGLNIYDDSATGNLTTVNIATKVKIIDHNFDETDGSGSCPGIGTEVVTVTNHGPKHQFTSSNINASTDQFTATDHGYKNGDAVIYHKNGNTELQIPSGALPSGFVYWVRRISDDVFSLCNTKDDAVNNGNVINLANNQTISGTHIIAPSLVINSTGSLSTYTGSVATKKNLIVRLNALGQQGVSPNYSAANEGPGGQNYRCSYNLEVVLLHGGEGWQKGDTARVWPAYAAEGAQNNNNAAPAYMDIEVMEHETVQVKATISTNGDGLIRPQPTPFSADTAVTADNILGGLTQNLPSGISARVIGTGVYYSSNNPFSIEIVEEDLMRVMQKSTNDVQNLTNQCRHGYIVKIANARVSEEDDYYLRFEGENNLDGVGSWTECAKPGIPLKLTNMPLVIQRTSSTQFTVREFTYQNRLVGDETTNPLPSFHGSRINKVGFFRNRLAFLSGENVILCRPGTLGTPDFFVESALTVGAADPIDISAASMFPSELFDLIEINTGLLVFSSNQQFLLSTDSEILNPETAKLRSVSTYNYNIDIPPISLGTTVAYLDNSGKFSRLNEMANVQREGEPQVVEQSKIVPTLLPKKLDLLTNSRENQMILIGKTNSDTVFGYRYFNVGDKREQQAWFKWKFNNPLLYHFVINDDYFLLDTDNFLQKMSLVQADTDPSIDQDSVNYLLHLDNFTTVANGSYNATTDITTFTNQSDWIDQVTTPNGTLVVVDDNAGATRVGRYAEPTVINNDDFTLPGNWSGATLRIGYLYDYQVTFPTLYPTRQEGERSRSDVDGSLILHRLRLHFGKVGLYETKLVRSGKADYTEVYESTELDEYNVDDAPFVDEFIQTVPVYEKNTNVDITLTSTHPSPATLLAMTWEGNFTPRFYKRV
tara:strand:+ start:615 stop:3932 length:3318 start_codon:yes stop_codon:yes gene_type:complete